MAEHGYGAPVQISSVIKVSLPKLNISKKNVCFFVINLVWSIFITFYRFFIWNITEKAMYEESKS